jgi:predicted membrane GTPase involved in stress response
VVVNEVFDLFAALDASEEQLDSDSLRLGQGRLDGGLARAPKT